MQGREVCETCTFTCRQAHTLHNDEEPWGKSLNMFQTNADQLVFLMCGVREQSGLDPY